MRKVFNDLCLELGYSEGSQIFEWYCRAYNVTIEFPAPASVAHEVFGL